ncbi:MAG: succinate dehydrogenase assembly factor 2 [Hyphomicrobiaceae bacterium]|nr:succinate dehydrogenase assembly factor 2 [Hyphomicrobiaceae bacterium]
MIDIEQRRRRAAYRALHRGTKEMDWLLGRYAEASLSMMEDPLLAEFERLLALPDPDLQRWIMGDGLPPESELFRLMSAIRAFHGLGAKPEAAVS